MKKRVLCFDLGASSGRAILAQFDGERIELNQIHRFTNQYVNVNGTDYWDILRLFHEIITGLIKAEQAGGYDTLGIDTWGVDYGLLDQNGDLIGNPIQYRDHRTSGILDLAKKYIDLDQLYSLTGNQVMEINTVFQLLADKTQREYVLNNTKHVLLISDLLAYMLTGTKSTDMSMASTTQMFNPRDKKWSSEVMNKIQISSSILPEISQIGTSKGTILSDLCDKFHLKSQEVVTVCGHDTQCASFAVPVVDEEKDYLFLSCGTWSLLGTVIDEPIINEQSAALNITNEIGYDGKITFLKNMTGLWLIQETRTYLSTQGCEYDFQQLISLAQQAEDYEAYIDTDADVFARHGDIPTRVKDYCQQTGQKMPQNIGEVLRCIYLSLAMKYRQSMENIQSCTGCTYKTIYMVGGGVQDQYLSQLTADVCQRDVVAGPKEATVMGNAAIQLIYLGAIQDEKQARMVVRKSEEVLLYHPNKNYEDAYNKYKLVMKER